jgi:hypothetical protein
MKAEEKQALIERCKTISSWREKYGDFANVMLPAVEAQQIAEIALAALTAQPVKLSHEWVHIRFTDRSKSQRVKCQIAWSDSLNSVIYDEEGNPLLIANSGYEVQE